ncbi:GTP-binding protein Obg/CgtA [Punctularia strigosozonata HHB-11173 SS5]|uniref:GTP-binding protein Obg/CgtA n=1 Tax=Punctularia strigosozonata (strain HHB-11173) TaxID=741275 RepID=UPI00044163D9|nr:GTP-binding protein Obg/CgtA [Punctularia strigosozonata HHB-11173 SS5]EIN14607.1 GTP-binding protein Obg/CgtA [Punctularia strigosozonata HHB-11173 SS5]
MLLKLSHAATRTHIRLTLVFRSISTPATFGTRSSANGHGPSQSSSSRIEDAASEALRKKRKTEWKRRQHGETFLDHVIINVRAGKGGDGCVAFHREKFQQYGPPAGGNGGRGGDVYIMPTQHLTTLSEVPKRVRGNPGGNGSGSWLHGRNGEPTVIKVPVGTVVRKLPPDDPRFVPDDWEKSDQELAQLTPEERKEKIRERRFLHFPNFLDENVVRPDFKDVEDMILREEREIRMQHRRRSTRPLELDLASVEETTPDPNAPLGMGTHRPLGYLIAAGGQGGLGNPSFITSTTRSPKFATRGYPGERVTLELELKVLADIGLVGMPNAGKSTLLKALTGGRARSAVAGYAFTTLNPVIAVVRVLANGGFVGEGTVDIVHDETRIEEDRKRALLEGGAFADALTRNQARDGRLDDLAEVFRFTVADNPGLVSRASENVGLGHSFLRSIERSLALAYVVDLSGPAPWDELAILRDELEKYQEGLSKKARMVVANKADLLGGDGTDQAQMLAARDKLRRLEEFVKAEMRIPLPTTPFTEQGQDPRPTYKHLDVIPVSGRYSQNLRRVVALMQSYVEEARLSESDVTHVTIHRTGV